MKIIQNTYRNTNHGFTVLVTTCNKRVATTENIETGEIVKYNRSKFEWMIKEGIFVEVVALTSIETELENVIEAIKEVNDSREYEDTISKDETNEVLVNILQDNVSSDVEDTEDSIAEYFGNDALHHIRDAEQGSY